MKNKIIISTIIVILIIILDQYIKYIFVNGFEFHTKVFSLILTYNYGIAFSMLEFLSYYLKYIQLFILSIAIVYIIFNKQIFTEYHIPIAMIFGGGISNILDRFTYGGVVDYFYWHYWFDFAIFNLADVIINLSIILILLKQYINYKIDKNKLKIG